MVLGGFAVKIFGQGAHWSWKAQLALFLVPTAMYGMMFFGQHFPKSEASQKGLSLGQMLKDVGIIGAAVIGLFIGLFVKDGLGPLLNGFTGSEFFVSAAWKYISIGVGASIWLLFSGLSGWSMGAGLLFVLFITHALVGAVELGTDGWIQNITGSILSPSQGTNLFIFTSAIMFGLRFCTHFIEKNLKLSPVGILLACAMLACFGLNLVSGITAFGGAMGALLVYAIGKSFFWPTMLAVTSDRFPRTGAVAISIMGGIGMMSAGLIGSPGLGYAKDRFAAESVPTELKSEYISSKESKWLVFEGVKTIDGDKLGDIKKKLDDKTAELAKQNIEDPKAVVDSLSGAEQKIHEANIQGNRKTLKADSYIPATMAGIYLLLFLYFKAIGGYKPLQITEESTERSQEPVAV
jgi:hypothetical protein